MIPAISEIINQTPPTVAYFLGFFMALALRRGRINSIVERFVPSDETPSK